MGDILIRNVPVGVLAVIDARAARLGLSRTEYVRRRLAQDAVGEETVSAAHLAAFSEMFADLGDDDVMAGAWE